MYRSLTIGWAEVVVRSLPDRSIDETKCESILPSRSDNPIDSKVALCGIVMTSVYIS